MRPPELQLMSRTLLIERKMYGSVAEWLAKQQPIVQQHHFHNVQRTVCFHKSRQYSDEGKFLLCWNMEIDNSVEMKSLYKFM